MKLNKTKKPNDIQESNKLDQQRILNLKISNDNFSNLHNNKRKHEKEREHFPGPTRQYNISEFKSKSKH
jgi:hypothetical protein